MAGAHFTAVCLMADVWPGPSLQMVHLRCSQGVILNNVVGYTVGSMTQFYHVETVQTILVLHTCFVYKHKLLLCHLYIPEYSDPV